MNCPSCQTYNPDNARYCARCGTLLEAPGEGQRVRHDQPSSEPEEPQEPYPYAGKPTTRLVPRTLGELIRETLAVYIGNFGVMLWLAFMANIPLFIALFFSNLSVVSAISLAGLFTSLLAYAAAAYGVGRWYIGLKTNAVTCFVAALNNAPSLLLASLVWGSAMLAGLLLSLLFIGIPLLVFVAVIWFCYVQAIVIESRRPADALRRSFDLVHGSRWRVFGIGTTFFALLLVTALPGYFISLQNQFLGDVLGILIGMVVTPFAYISATLVYFDLRIRKEGYTLETLATELGFSQDSSPPGPTTAEP